jgi:hypothetical protein
MDLQKQMIQMGTPKNAFLILDDCVGSVNFNSKLWDVLATTARQYNITIIVTFQRFKKCPPVIRQNSEYVFVLKMIDDPSLQVLHEELGSSFADYKQFKAFIIRNTENYQCVMINNNTPNTAINNMFSILKAPQKFTQKQPNCFELNF